MHAARPGPHESRVTTPARIAKGQLCSVQWQDCCKRWSNDWARERFFGQIWKRSWFWARSDSRARTYTSNHVITKSSPSSGNHEASSRRVKAKRPTHEGTITKPPIPPAKSQEGQVLGKQFASGQKNAKLDCKTRQAKRPFI